jgi:hypothetical protein
MPFTYGTLQPQTTGHVLYMAKLTDPWRPWLWRLDSQLLIRGITALKVLNGPQWLSGPQLRPLGVISPWTKKMEEGVESTMLLATFAAKL